MKTREVTAAMVLALGGAAALLIGGVLSDGQEADKASLAAGACSGLNEEGELDERYAPASPLNPALAMDLADQPERPRPAAQLLGQPMSLSELLGAEATLDPTTGEPARSPVVPTKAPKRMPLAPERLPLAAKGGNKPGTPGTPLRPPPSVLSIASGDGQSGMIGTALPQPLMVALANRKGQAAVDHTVQFSVVSGTATLSAQTVQTDGQGLASVMVTLGADAGPIQVRAEAINLKKSLAPITFNLTAVKPVASDISLASGDKQTGVAGSGLQQPLVVKVIDNAGQPAQGFKVAFAVASGGGALSASEVATDAAGLASVSLTLGKVAGANSVTASAAGLKGSPVTFTANGVAGPASMLALVSGDKQTGVVGAALKDPFVVAVGDANGNGIANVQIDFKVTAGGGTLSAATAMTDAAGRAGTVLKLGAAPGANTVVATSPALPNMSITFSSTATAVPAAAAAIASGDKQSGVAGSALAQPMVVRVTDQNGGPVEGFAVQWAVASGGGSLAAAESKTDAAGLASMALTLGKAAGPNSVTATAGNLTGSPLTFTATGTAGPAAKLVIASGDKQTAVVGTPFKDALAVKVTDANDNAVSGVQVAFAVSAGVATLTPASAATDAAGLASTALTAGATPSTINVTATATGLTPVTFTSTSTAVPPAKIVRTSGDAQSGVAGSALTNPLVVTVLDANDQPVSGFMVAFAVASGGGSLSATSVATNAQGQAATSLTLGKVAGPNTVTANATGLAGSPITFTATGQAGPAALVTKTSGDAQTGVAGAPLKEPFVVTVKDAGENPVAGYTVEFAVAAGGGKLSAATVVTDAKGEASTILTLGNTPGTNTVTATAGNLAGSPLSFSASAIAAPATTLTLISGDKQTGVAGAALANPFVLQVTDAANTPVEGFTVAFAVASGGGNLSATSVKTNAMGLAQAVLTTGATAGPNSVTVTAQGLTGSPMTLTAMGLAGPAAELSIVSGNNQSGVAGSALKDALVVAVKDANGNAVQGSSVAFAAATGGGSVNPTTATTGATGQASTVLTLGAAVAANTVTATVQGLTPVTFTANAMAAPAASIALVDGDNQTGVAGAPLAKALTVVIRDAANNPVQGFNVAFAVATGGGSLSAATATSGANGQASVTLTLGAKIGPNTVTANAQGLTGSPITFTAAGVAGPAAKLAIASGDNQTALVGKALTNPLVVLVTDANDNPVGAKPVAFAVASGGGSVNPTTTTTNVQGQASTVLTVGTNAGPNTVTAVVDGLTPVTFTASAMAAPAASVELTSGNDQTAPAGNKLANPLVVTVKDAAGNPVEGFMVAFTVATGGGSLSASTVATAANGQASTELTLGAAAGPNTVTANAAGLAGSPLTFAATGLAGPAAIVNIDSGNNQSGRAGTALTNPLVVTVRDANNNVVSGATVAFAVTNGGGSVAPASAASDANGKAATSLTLGTTVGANTVTATVAGLTPVTFTADATGLTYDDDVAPILNTRCIACHGPGGIFAARQFTTYEQIRNGISLGNMPYVVPADIANSVVVQKTGAGGSMSGYLTAAQAKTISDWVATGALKDAAGTPLATAMGKTSGDAQTAAPATALPQPLVVTVSDAGGNPVPNVVVIWTATAGGGALSADRVTTDAMGRSQVTWTLGAVAGTNTATAEVQGLTGSPATFTATGGVVGAYSGEPLASSTNPLDVAALVALKDNNIEPAPLADDGEFLRRVTSAILGRLPSDAELAAFEADASPTKRAAVIDMLLADPSFGTHWAKNHIGPWTGVSSRIQFTSNNVTTVYENDISTATALNNDVTLSQLVTELSTSVGDHGLAFARTYSSRGGTYMADRMMSAFAGMSSECARCHDHLLTTPLDDPRWTQDDNYGLYAFFATSSGEARKRDKEGRRFGDPLLPAFVADGYANAPTIGLDFNDSVEVRRAKFAEVFTASNAFHRGTSHRIWASIAKPLLNRNQFLQAELAAVQSPMLLDALAQTLRDQGGSLKGFLRVALNSRLYQLTSAGTKTDADPYQGRFQATRHDQEVVEVGGYQLAGLTMGNSSSDFRRMFGYPDNRPNIASRTNDVNFGQALLQMNSTASVPGKVTSSSSRIANLAAAIDGGAVKEFIPSSNLVSASGNTGGLDAAIYDTIDFTGTPLNRIDPQVNFNFGSNSPDPAIGADTFSIRWTGSVRIPANGSYTFYARTDDGVRVWIDGNLVIDQFVNQGPTERSATLNLTAGDHTIRMDYFENSGGAVAELRWSSPILTGTVTFDDAVTELFRAGLSRNPTADELTAARNALTEAGNTRVALEDIAVAIGATAEFVFR